jgi:hypothetical protein
VRRLAAGLLALALAAPAGAQTASPDGAWEGMGFQVDHEGFQSSWMIRLELSGRTGLISYPDLGCEGRLKRVSSARGEAEFAETISSGPCVDGGRVVVKRAGGRLFWFWYGAGGIDASAVLYPADRIS